MIRIMIFDLIDAWRLLGDRMELITKRENCAVISCDEKARYVLTNNGIWWE